MRLFVFVGNRSLISLSFMATGRFGNFLAISCGRAERSSSASRHTCRFVRSRVVVTISPIAAGLPLHTSPSMHHSSALELFEVMRACSEPTAHTWTLGVALTASWGETTSSISGLAAAAVGLCLSPPTKGLHSLVDGQGLTWV